MLTFTPFFKTYKEKKDVDSFLVENIKVLKKVLSDREEYDNHLGWFNCRKYATQNHLNRIIDISSELRAKADVLIVVGVGGSNNAARGVIEALKFEMNGPEILYSGNTLSPRQINELLKKIHGKSVYIHFIAKNFQTLEPGTTFRILRQYLYREYGSESAHRVIVTGTKGSVLEKICQNFQYEFLEFPLDVGGRYSALTNVGLLPMAVAGIDIISLVRGAKEMQNILHSEMTIQNSAYQYACYRRKNYLEGYQVEMLASFEPQFNYFYKWWVQLFAESEGKNNQGIYPTTAKYSEDLHSVGQYVQEGPPILFETFLVVIQPNDKFIIQPDDVQDGFDYLDGQDLWRINQAAFKATSAAHVEKLPVAFIEIDALDAYHFGQLFYFFQFSCYLSCGIAGVNPFDQPGVEAYKDKMFYMLKK